MSKQKHAANSMATLATKRIQKVEVPHDLNSLSISNKDKETITDIISQTKKHGKVVVAPNSPLANFVVLTGENSSKKLSTVAYIANSLDRQVYRIDLRSVVSKYIGETEKNLGRLFDKANNKDWILFFDEADALFGKRTNIRDAHDKYANQEISYLLQRIEDYPGLVLLASNFNENIDEAFLRRFQAKIYFPLPEEEPRENIWGKVIILIKNLFKKKTYVMVADVDGSELKAKEE